MSKNLTSWYDVPYSIWSNNQVIDKIRRLDFKNIFETNAFYPNKLTLLYSDLYIVQGVISYVLSLFSSNLILVFNLTVIITMLLNYISLYKFWGLFYENKLYVFLASVFFIFNPFFFYNFGHYQLMWYWPLFFCLYYFYRKNKKSLYFDSLFAGFFITIQFLSSVYMAMFLCVLVCVFALIEVFFNKKIIEILKKMVVVFGVFLLTCGYFIWGYLLMKKTYSFVRDPGEYVTYSAHLSDYVFTSGMSTVFNKIGLVKHWNWFNHHGWGERSGFPGITMSVLSIIGIGYVLVVGNRDKRIFRFGIKLDKKILLFFVISLIGFVFSLGTRLSFNGTYAHIPLPYNFIVKYVPMFDSVRATARWCFLFYLGVVGMAMVGLSKLINFTQLKTHKIMLTVLVCVFLLIEHLPVSVKSSHEEYYVGYEEVESLCKSSKMVLLELPVGHLDYMAGIVEGLSYITKLELASVRHGCNIINGYSGYEPPSLVDFKEKIYSYKNSNDFDGFVEYLTDYGVNLIKINDEDWSWFVENVDKNNNNRFDIVDEDVYLVKY